MCFKLLFLPTETQSEPGGKVLCDHQMDKHNILFSLPFKIRIETTNEKIFDPAQKNADGNGWIFMVA